MKKNNYSNNMRKLLPTETRQRFLWNELINFSLIQIYVICRFNPVVFPVPVNYYYQKEYNFFQVETAPVLGSR